MTKDDPAQAMKRLPNVQHKRVVEAGGGLYVGPCFEDLVMFDSPATGSTLALPENELTADAVRHKIMESNKAFGIPQ